MDRNAIRQTRRLLFIGILSLGVLSLVPISAQAWGPGGRRGPSPDRATARLTEQLGLTADQQAKVKSVLEESFTKRAELREAHRKEMDALRDETHQQLAAVLTPEQVTKLDELRQEREAHRGHRGECGGGRGSRGEGRPSSN